MAASREFLTRVAPLTVMLAPLIGAASQAQVRYRFVDLFSGDVLASLEFSSLPATHTEVLSLEFTPTGQSRFGYGSVYPGKFDLTGNPFERFGGDRLGHIAGSLLTDSSPPGSRFHQQGTQLVRVSAGRAFGEDLIEVTPSVLSPDRRLFAVGDWVLVPEPSSAALATAAALLALLGRRVKPPRCSPAP